MQAREGSGTFAACGVAGCAGYRWRRGLCRRHFNLAGPLRPFADPGDPELLAALAVIEGTEGKEQEPMTTETRQTEPTAKPERPHCVVPGCKNIMQSRGLCFKHCQLAKHGDAEALQYRLPSHRGKRRKGTVARPQAKGKPAAQQKPAGETIDTNELAVRLAKCLEGLGVLRVVHFPAGDDGGRAVLNLDTGKTVIIEATGEIRPAELRPV